ncbi:PD-(D/E)XK nuclease family protein [Marinimicrobium sp. ABcell2]|uniref:PD-(D/E)XK nuclease family protein n=1 Tax=Marinimicrobium sp. ABcell2 TaxID=3069751 RepID=UPI0027B33348|nr:PD-(D/E)XK nuclease family protein [Marinimicrobium sp. ABcell2]MDQ2078024.1 PD-(D/E)XK nuclease family protein [Marinimicrobium sp. ABcell2]
MVAALFDLTPLRQALRDGELILTANDRLRRHILRAWSEEQRRQGISVWHAPRVQALNRWLEKQWQTLVESGYPGCRAAIADRQQRQLLWERVIADSPESELLLQAEPLSGEADAALRTLELWQTELTACPEVESDANSAYFVRWLDSFQQRLSEQKLITPEAAHGVVATAFLEGSLPKSERIWLEGFDDLPPLHQHLLEAASRELITVPSAAVANNRLIRTESADAESEIRAAALWSLERLQQDPAAVLGIIVPDLGQRRAQLERLFSEVFESAAALPDTPRYTLPFNFSAGQPLGTTALVHSALSLLRLTLDEAELEALCALLHSPFWGEPEEERVLRTQLTDRLRNLGKFTLTGSDWRYHSQRLIQQLGLPQPDSLAERLQKLDEHRRRHAGRASAAHWAEIFCQQLTLLGWPGPRRLDSQEYQQLTLWHELLETFSKLDATGFQLSHTQALKQLSQLAMQTPFQAQTPDSPIQILGVLEGAGLRFSHCWVMGLHHRQWPPPPAPNSLLPLDLQRAKHMPHSSAERELSFALSLTENYRHCAQEVVFSSPQTDAQGELRASPLIRSLPATAIETLTHTQLTSHQQYYRQLAQSRALEAVDCARGPAVDLHAQAPGGSSLFKHQASCPFNAFARLRLGAQQPNAPVVGLSPAERGTVLHETLAFAWKQLKNSTSLQQQSDDALQQLLGDCCDQALEPFRKRRPRELGPTYCQLERERLQQLLGRWLALEKQRPPFEVVAIEEQRELVFEGLKLTLRIDRVDRLASGELLLIDYKTGMPSTNSWLSERPSEPQLPLYTISQPDGVAGIAFAQLNAKALRWIGMGELQSPLEGVKAPPKAWTEQVDEWQQVLQQLAREFIAGDARVDFKDNEASRFSDDLLPLNRALEADTLRHLLTEPDGLNHGY